MARRSFGGGPAKEQTQGPSTTSTDSQANRHPSLGMTRLEGDGQGTYHLSNRPGWPGRGRPRLHPLLDLDLELQIPFDALNAGFPYVVLTATRRKSPPKRSLDEAPSRIFLP